MDRPEPSGDSLTHYGVKGMKWGVRKSSDSSGGGRNKLPPSEDFQNVSANRAKIRSGGTKALSNKELQDVVTRMNLEEQYHTLKEKKKNRGKGRNALNKIMTTNKKVNQILSVANSPAGKIVRKAMLGV